MQSPNIPYMARVDHLRFFAAAMVLLYHGFHYYVNPHVNPGFPLLTVIDEGHMGVSIFMVLSGFILAVISNGKRIAYGKFVQNRILRIYPLYMFIMFLTMYVDRMKYTVLSLLSFILPVNNLGDAVGGDVAPQMWTIAIEFQFYLIFPFLMLFIERYGLRYLLWLCILCVVVRAFILGCAGPYRTWLMGLCSAGWINS
jgi:peptidoglycan/LPS O-acetylase OafA/YrhL